MPFLRSGAASRSSRPGAGRASRSTESSTTGKTTRRRNGDSSGIPGRGAPRTGGRPLSTCGFTQPFSSFPYRSREAATRHWICLSCQREVTRAWYLRRAPTARRVSGYGLKIRQSLVAQVDEYLSAHGCVDCGEANPILLDFDHLRDKTSDVATMVVSARPWTEVQSELAKCVVRCANCHARKTAIEVGSYRVAVA